MIYMIYNIYIHPQSYLHILLIWNGLRFIASSYLFLFDIFSTWVRRVIRPSAEPWQCGDHTQETSRCGSWAELAIFQLDFRGSGNLQHCWCVQIGNSTKLWTLNCQHRFMSNITPQPMEFPCWNKRFLRWQVLKPCICRNHDKFFKPDGPLDILWAACSGQRAPYSVCSGITETNNIVGFQNHKHQLHPICDSVLSQLLVHTVHTICPIRHAQPAPSSAAGKRRRDVLKVRGVEGSWGVVGMRIGDLEIYLPRPRSCRSCPSAGQAAKLALQPSTAKPNLNLRT